MDYIHLEAGGDGLDWRLPPVQRRPLWEVVGSVWGAERRCRLPHAFNATTSTPESSGVGVQAGAVRCGGVPGLRLPARTRMAVACCALWRRAFGLNLLLLLQGYLVVAEGKGGGRRAWAGCAAPALRHARPAPPPTLLLVAKNLTSPLS